MNKIHPKDFHRLFRGVLGPLAGVAAVSYLFDKQADRHKFYMVLKITVWKTEPEVMHYEPHMSEQDLVLKILYLT